ncbi:hypothetical protein JOQ06_022666 [Pogonophryne albipinna]|uniref:DH domain-containing protein n=1 Tax=Pogonophryne albipinna TaxID=1090488 RepID=A0AAD6F4G6_9TELE|nr:hypothetical protein JOQ06_022666 [Pogonophryne albipinna]
MLKNQRNLYFLLKYQTNLYFLLKNQRNLYFLLKYQRKLYFLLKYLRNLYFLLKNLRNLYFLLKYLRNLYFLLKNQRNLYFLLKNLRNLYFLLKNPRNVPPCVPQSGQEEMKLLSLLLAPVSRIHAYLSHIQSLLQWTRPEHPDCSLLLGAERALRSVLTRCHQTLQEDVQWEEAGGQSSDAESEGCSEGCRRQQTAGSSSVRREGGSGLTNGPSMRVECLSCSPVRRTFTPHPHPGCGHACCSLLTPSSPAAWGENSDSGKGTYRQEPPHPHLQSGGETDPDDTVGFSFSSVVLLQPRWYPDGWAGWGRKRKRRRARKPVLAEEGGAPGERGNQREGGSKREEGTREREGPREREGTRRERGNQERGGPREREGTRERAMCLRWQIPRLTPHPPPCPAPSEPSGTTPNCRWTRLRRKTAEDSSPFRQPRQGEKPSNNNPPPQPGKHQGGPVGGQRGQRGGPCSTV